MKKIIFLTIVFLSSLSIVTLYKQPILSAIDGVLYYSPCTEPIPYRVGFIDSRFDMPLDDFRKSIERAEKIWEQTAEGDLFVYDPKAKLSINMVYDERQYLKNQIDQMGNELNQKNDEIVPEVSEYESYLAEVEKQLAEYNAKVKYWNSRGGATQEEYEKLMNEQREIRDKTNTIKQMANDLNRSTEAYNEQISKLNATIETFGNTINARPEEGIYDPKNNKIDVYFNINQDELIHTLAHELGHALGLEHNTNETSIMFSFTSQRISATPEDISALRQQCRKRSVIGELVNGTR